MDEFIDKITRAGGKVVQSKMEIPQVGFFASAMDTEGNLFGIMEPLAGK